MNHLLKQKQMNGNKIYRANRGEDRISLLPDPLLSKILLNLPTKDVVKTSLLSTRWRSVWLSVPGLDLDDNEFPNYASFVNFVNKFVMFSIESPFEKLKLTSRREESFPLAIIKSWVKKVIGRKIQYLEINYFRRYIVFEFLPRRLFVCDTLVYLRIRYLAFNELNHASLPCLKKMHLEEVWFTNRGAIQTLIASCPVLEDLSIIRCQDGAKVLRLCSQTITNINLVLDVTDRWDIHKWEVVIDTPRLNYLSLKNNRPTSLTINSLCSPSKVDIGIDFNVKIFLDLNDLAKSSSIGNFLNCISTVRDMTICGKTLKVFHQYSKLEPLPQFCNMSQMHAKISAANLKMFPDLLESCPNLKSLVLELNGSTKKKLAQLITFSSVPWCLWSSLENLEMKKPIGRIGVEMELIRYFLENSKVLKKLTLRLGGRRMKEESMLKELMSFRKCSSVCQVVVVGLEGR